MINDLLLKTDDDTESLKKNEIIPFSETEAIALIEDVKLTKYQYEAIRSQIKQRNADILVPYKQLSFAKKQCYPAEAAFSITETGVKIKLQALLDHIASRILQVQNVVPVNFEKEQSVSLTLITKWGCDGADGDLISDNINRNSLMIVYRMKVFLWFRWFQYVWNLNLRYYGIILILLLLDIVDQYNLNMQKNRQIKLGQK